jgi:outer membrane protein assembly factor BamB
MQQSPQSAPLLVIGWVIEQHGQDGPGRNYQGVCGIDGRDGHERWRVELERGNVVPPNGLAADQGLVYAATIEGIVYAMRAGDGGLVWQRRVTHRHPTYPPQVDLRAMAGGGILAVDYARPDLPPSDRRRITVLDGRDGSELWIPYLPHASPWGLARRLFLGWNVRERAGGVLLGADTNGVYVTEVIDRSPLQPDQVRTVLLDRSSGRRRWSTRQAAATNAAGHWGSRTTLAPAGGTAYTVGKRLAALDTSSGKTRWSRPIPSGDGLRPGPLIANETVLCAAYDSCFCVYRTLDGELLWQLVRGGAPVPMSAFLGMVLMDGAIYVSRWKYQSFGVEAHDTLTGDLRWEWPRPDASSQKEPLARADISWRLVGAEGVLYVPGPTSLCAVRASDGELLWQLPKAGGLPALVALAN